VPLAARREPAHSARRAAASAPAPSGSKRLAWQPRVLVELPRAEPEPRTFAGEITTAVARIIGEAATRGDSAEAQAEQVLDELNRRGLLHGAPEEAKYSSTAEEAHSHVMPS
jgi:hypothetical protein